MKCIPISILASYSTLKSMVDANQYKDAYQILAEFIQYIIVKNNIHTFGALQMKNLLFDEFGFNVPEAVVNAATKHISFISRNKRTYTVDSSTLKADESFEEKRDSAEATNSEIINLLISFAKSTDSTSDISENELTQEFIAFLLDDHQTVSTNKYTELIGRFVLKYESDEKVQSALTAIREGSIIYIGLNHNMKQVGSIKKTLTLFLEMEVLFSLVGYNGEIYKKLALDFYEQIKNANSKEEKIRLCYFSDVKNKIESFFYSAEQIVEGKLQLYFTVAMNAIINGCENVSDVMGRKAHFYTTLESYGIVEDEETNYYASAYDAYNLETLSSDPRKSESLKHISHINKLRKGRVFQDNIDSEYLVVTNKWEIISTSIEQKRNRAKENKSHVCDYAVSVEWITNMLWYRLGNGLGGKDYPVNVNAALKARMLLASNISNRISELFYQKKGEYTDGIISERELALTIIYLRTKASTPDELSADTIEDDLKIDVNSYEEELKRTREANQVLRDEGELQRSKIQEQQKENTELAAQVQEQQKEITAIAAQLAEYQKIKRRVCWVGKLLLELGIACVIIYLLYWFCKKVDTAIKETLSIAISFLGAFSAFVFICKKNKKEFEELFLKK